MQDMTVPNRGSEDSDFAIIVQQPGKPQQVLVRYLTLLLNYRYGLDIIVVRKFVEAFSTIQRYRDHIRCAVVVQNRRIESRSSIAPLSDEGGIPLFLLLPRSLIPEHQQLCHRMVNVQFCAWENAFSHTGSSLHKVMAATFAELGIGDLFVEAAAMPPADSEAVQRRFPEGQPHRLRTGNTRKGEKKFRDKEVCQGYSSHLLFHHWLGPSRRTPQRKW